MPEINWSLAQPHDIGGSFVNALAQGMEFRDRRDRQNALLAQSQAELEMKRRQMAHQQQQAQQEQRRADLPLIGRLLDHAKDETTYQQARAAAQQYGIDVSNLPPSFDPAWVQQQRTMVHALSDPVKLEALSTAGKQAVDMGYKPGTPEFNRAVQSIWQAGEAKPYVVGGETRLYQPQIGGQGAVLGADLPQGFQVDAPAQGGPAAAPQTPFAQAFADFPARP